MTTDSPLATFDDPMPSPAPDAAPHAAHDRGPGMARGTLGAWWWQGLRTWLMMRPQWPAQVASPAVVLGLLLVGIASGVLVERLFIVGDATFHWPALLGGWFPTVATLWACWMAAGKPASPTSATPPPLAHAAPVVDADLYDASNVGCISRQPDAVSLFALQCAQLLPAALVSALLLVPIYRAGDAMQSDVGRWLLWGAWAGMLAWLYLAQVMVLWRGGEPSRVWPRLLAAVVLVGGGLLQMWMSPERHWYPADAEQTEGRSEDEAAFEPARFTQEEMEQQAPLLQHKLRSLQALKRGQTGLYAITFAPYADEDVFKRESQLVASLMQERFGAAGRTIQLVNNRATLGQWPWATPLNLQRTIGHMAGMMKRDEDVLFIHLTSHGASNGELAAQFEPLDMAPVTPVQLKRWLDEAGVRWRVISISACYSGSWVPVLADARTLLMTAADADHTSYGCGRRSDLTFFGRAMYDEQLRGHFSFERAHAAARPIIERREQEAGKDDGYSNPQIRMGEAIRGRLQVLEQGLARAQQAPRR